MKKKRYNGRHPKTGRLQVCTNTGKGKGRKTEVKFSDGATSTIGESSAVKAE